MPELVGKWAERAACKGQTSLFFPEEKDHRAFARAVAICEGCPVRSSCYEHALTTGERYGVWGGVAPKTMKRHRKELGITIDDLPAECGTRARYGQGCRCLECRQANTLAARKRRNRAA